MTSPPLGKRLVIFWQWFNDIKMCYRHSCTTSLMRDLYQFFSITSIIPHFVQIQKNIAKYK
jgi:hypothetical protein